MQAAGHLVAVVIKFATGVQDREHHFGSRPAVGHLVYGNTAAVVHDRDRVVDVDRDVDLIAEASQRLVYGVVDDFVDQMVQPGRPGRADVHGRPLPDGFQAFQDFDLVGAVVRTG